MTKYEQTLRALRAEVEKHEKRLERLRTAIGVLEEYDEGDSGVVADEAKERAQKAKASAAAPPARPKAAPVRLAPPAKPERAAVIAASAQKLAAGKCDVCARKATAEKACPCGYTVRGCAEHAGKALGGRFGGHARRCPKTARPAKPAKEPEPAPAAVAVPPVIAAIVNAARGREKQAAEPRRIGRPAGSVANGQRLYRCVHPVAREHGGGLVAHGDCGAMVWEKNRSAHLRREHELAGTEAEVDAKFAEQKDLEEAA